MHGETFYSSQNQQEEALGMFKKAHRIFRKTLGAHSVEAGDALGDMANALHRQGRYQEAMEKVEESLAIQRTLLGNDHADLGSKTFLKALCKAKTGDSEGHLACLKEAHRLFKRGRVETPNARRCADLLNKELIKAGGGAP
mmetsp:Transcript_35370/g.69230  ORF Transcript_35370/g.69230 Transcript_35370/m.69230 type:complete len:141 (-) Transcript_35370:4-426(-)